MQARAVILAVAVATVASGPAWAENVLRWSTPAEHQTFDPHGVTGYVPIQSIIQVYEGLVRRTAGTHFGPEPGLAVSWRLVEPTAWEFELRPGVTFHDGAPFTADDVVFSIERAKSKRGGYYKQRVLDITEVEIHGSHRVWLRTAEPDPSLPDRLMLFPIMSKTWTEATGVLEPQALDHNYLFDHASGTGPFQLISATPDGTVVLARNPDWWGLKEQPHNIDRIIHTRISDERARAEAVLRGEQDLAFNPSFELHEQIEATPGVELVAGPSLRVVYLGMDQGNPELRTSSVKGRNPFADKRVRLAVYHAIDVERLRDEVLHGLAQPAGMLVARQMNGWSEEFNKRLPHDPARAKLLLAEVGYPRGFNVSLDCSVGDVEQRSLAICEALARDLAQIGIHVSIVQQPSILKITAQRSTDFWLSSLVDTTFDSGACSRCSFTLREACSTPQAIATPRSTTFSGRSRRRW
jgi:peptide/nickel transport system substrate-binding protein